MGTKALQVLETRGARAYMEYMFTHPEDNDNPNEEMCQLSYTVMRMWSLKNVVPQKRVPWGPKIPGITR